MKTYIGTKTVQAEPCVYGQFVERTGKQMNTTDGQVRPYHAPGYLVQYPDGYISWSPADVFEDSYHEAETPLDRLEMELMDVSQRETKLAKFIQSDNFKKLGLSIQAALKAQHITMYQYCQLMAQRAENMRGEKEDLLYGLSFSIALELLAQGFVVRRKGWNNNKLMVFRQVPALIKSEIIPNMQSLPDEAKRLILTNKGDISYNSQCLIYNPETGRADSWAPSISDVFSYDWELVTQ